MNCPKCSKATEVIKTDPAAMEGKGRLRKCPKHGPFWSLERFVRWVAQLPVTRRQRQATTANAPPTTPQPPGNESAGGVGGALPSGVVSIAPSPDPDPSVLENPKRGRARNKLDASQSTLFVSMRDRFVESWVDAYGENYPFEARDGSALANFIRKHPQLTARWDEMLDRYFGSTFWANKRHPLWGLVTNPVEFSGETNGHSVPQKVTDSRRTALDWMDKEAS